MRSSMLLMISAVPPRGNPVTGSRGPAWFNPNPRSEFPPPAKKRSASGRHAGCPGLRLVALRSGLRHECVAETEFQSRCGWSAPAQISGPSSVSCRWSSSGILDQQPSEISLRAKVAVGHTAVNRGVVSFGGLEIVVALVADVTEVGNANPGGLGEQWNLVGTDRVLRCRSPAPADR